MVEFRRSGKGGGGVLGFLRTLFGIGVHRVVIFDDNGRTIGCGAGATLATAREQAWNDIPNLDRERPARPGRNR